MMMLIPMNGYRNGEFVIQNITVVAGEENENNDAGVEDPATASIAGRVFCDENDDSLDNGEPAVANITVQLLHATGVVLSTAVTDANGEYEFENKAGTHTVDFDENDADLAGKVLVTKDVNGMLTIVMIVMRQKLMALQTQLL